MRGRSSPRELGMEGGEKGSEGAKYGSTLTGLDMPRQGTGPRPRLELWI